MYLIYWKGRVGNAIAELCKLQSISYVLADDSDDIVDFSEYEAIIPSPWIPWTHRIYETGKIISELDFAYQFLPKNFQILSITGTDGKSTTTWILYSILSKLNADKKKVFLSGNFEIPFSETVAEILVHHDTEGIIVLEASSFMSYYIGKTSLPPFENDYMIFTNLKSDHLNWHRDLQEYADAKMNFVKHTKHAAVINTEVFDFLNEENLRAEKRENTIDFALVEDFSKNFFENYTDGEEIFVKNFGEIQLSETNFSGKHNAMNILSVMIVLRELGVDFKEFKQILSEISGLTHRLELIAEKNGVKIVEDSKSTSAQSLEAALGSYGDSKNILLIAGGSDKGDTFAHLEKIFEKRVKKVACIGATKHHFSDIAKNTHIEYLETDSMEEATKWLYNQAESGDVLLLSPGCASFGLFKDYLDRAHQFRAAVQDL